MKHTMCIIALVLGLGSCKNPTSENSASKNSDDSLQTTSATKQKQDIFIKDKTKYDQTFIEGLADYNEPIKLIDDYIVTGKDTTFFPTDLILNKPTIFTAIKDDNNYVLLVTRTNYTNLTYNFQLKDRNNKIFDTKSGQAILGSMFFLAPEGDIDTEMGSYGSYEYWDKSNNCLFSVRIGIGKDDNGKQRAKVNYNCDDRNKTAIDLDECPVLRTE